MKGLEMKSGKFYANSLMPQFRKEQRVSFLGGVGTVKNYLPDSNSWTYAIEMELGPEPEMGRIGPEAMILLPETDIQACMA